MDMESLKIMDGSRHTIHQINLKLLLQFLPSTAIQAGVQSGPTRLNKSFHIIKKITWKIMISFNFLDKPYIKVIFVGYFIILLGCINLLQIQANENISIYSIKQFVWLVISLAITFFVLRLRLRTLKNISTFFIFFQ